MRIQTFPARCILSLLCLVAAINAVSAEANAKPKTLMCKAGELLFSEDFDPETVSERWGFKGDFALRDDALVRTVVSPSETKRVFLKDVSFHNTVIQFDFRFAGQTTDLRLVTGSGGHYNSVTQIRPGHFEIHTPVDREAGIVPAHLGACIREPSPGQWQTMTVEYWGEEILSHISDKAFVLGKHPIVDRNRTYFAFQFDLPGASIDNVRVWKASGQLATWTESREKLAAIQADRDPVSRDPMERYKIAYTKLKSRLTLHDGTYRDLVTQHDRLQAALHQDYPEAFTTHKQISKQIAKRKKEIKETDSEFKQMETAVHRALRAEDAYVLSTKPELVHLKSPGIPNHRFASELGQVRAELESAGDNHLDALVAETSRLQVVLESRFPQAFESVDAAVENRKAIRQALNDDPRFQIRNAEVVKAGKAIKDYEKKAEPDLARLADEAKSHVDAGKVSQAK